MTAQAKTVVKPTSTYLLIFWTMSLGNPTLLNHSFQCVVQSSRKSAPLSIRGYRQDNNIPLQLDNDTMRMQNTQARVCSTMIGNSSSQWKRCTICGEWISKQSQYNQAITCCSWPSVSTLFLVVCTVGLSHDNCAWISQNITLLY